MLPGLQDSPLFSFINDLSPIEPLKSAYAATSLQGYQSINITSISSIFTSPHDNPQKEPRLPNSLAEISETGDCAEGSDRGKTSSKSSNAVRLFACTSTVTQETHTVTHSRLAEHPDGPCDLSQPSGQYNPGSPDHNKTPCHGVRSDLKQDKCTSKLEAVQTIKNTLEKRKCLFSTDIQLMDASQPLKDGDDVLGCEWSDLIPTTSGELLAYDTSIDEHHRGVQLAVNNAESCGYLLSKLTGDGDPGASSTTYYQELVMGEDQMDDAQIFQDGQQTISTEEIQDNIYEANGCIPPGYKVETQQQRGIRRRCLVFEASGFSNSVVQKETVKDMSTSCKGKSPVETKINNAKLQSRVPRGIGLHLNALAATPKGKIVRQDPTASALVSVSTSEHDMPGKLLSAGENFTHSSSELLEFPVDDSEGFPVNDHVSSQSGSPQKKRRKADNGDDGESCKRCSCKKSKCLKLYCECFAAGVYCSEPCSCQGCLNKPIHEEIVLSTRKLIEFRNPLAFAPKVIRMSDTSQETGEDPNNTPASARHKRGCNCKKSSCLKKYCECYQSGVGCSSNCRCESCKNTFGRRDADIELTEEMKQEGEETKSCGEKENDQQKENVQSDDHPLLELIPITPPFDLASSLLLKPPNFSSAKPPRPSKARTSSSRSSTSKATETIRSRKVSKVADSGSNEEMPHVLRDANSPSNGVKTTSPNGKRVSPPHNALSISPNRKGGRKLILKSIPSFPSLTGEASSSSAMNNTDNKLSAQPLALGKHFSFL
ncbi:hypothetical protein PR202_gb12442 [Eleusine coracana subsp. coracana]|uniref:CRC domain-containing protein n=1 Tax=Eleusine coracana subsp. coracana TaxID=191504 RepID=A0AAV5EQE8_ELECO|nr:hypothetical protein PR202_gb12442 [Eleusine coracana subsp. coracana]